MKRLLLRRRIIPRTNIALWGGLLGQSAPTQPTFCRLLQRVDARKVEEVMVAIQNQVRGPAPKEHLIVFDSKQPKHGGGASVLSAVTVLSQHYLGSALVDQKTNEIPIARELFKRLRVSILSVVCTVLTVIMALAWLSPVYWIAATALKSETDTIALPFVRQVSEMATDERLLAK